MKDMTQPLIDKNFYVSVVDGSRYRLLRGPFKTHTEALERVEETRRLATELDPKSWFYAFGTVGVKDWDKPGILNERFLDK